MILERLSFFPVVLIAVCSAVLLVSRNWRYSILALAIQYVGVFWLVGTLWPFGLAAVKLVAGWMAGAVLSASQPDEGLREGEERGYSEAVFRILAAGLVIALVVSVAPAVQARFPADLFALEGGLVLIGVGLLHMGMTVRPMRVILGLLTALSGFEILYAAVETSVLIAGLQAIITLGLALVGAYLLASPGMEEPGP
jgi:hypothetical protein